MIIKYLPPNLIGNTDFKVFTMAAHDHAMSVAISCIKQGYPNAYVGNPGIINYFDLTPLVILVGSNSVEWVKVALEAHADLNLPAIWRDDNTKVYPLMRAFEHGNIEMINLLLDYGADIKNMEIYDLLDRSIWMTKSVECVKLAME